MEKKKSFLRRSLSKALSFPWFGAKEPQGFPDETENWQQVSGRAAIEPVFAAFTALLAEHCADLSKAAPEARWLWESGSLDHGSSYFYFQRYDEEGMLIERTDHGWFSIPAVKVVADDSFIRGQVVAETATVLKDPSKPGDAYVRSTIIGKHPVVLALYADTFLEAFA